METDYEKCSAMAEKLRSDPEFKRLWEDNLREEEESTQEIREIIDSEFGEESEQFRKNTDRTLTGFTIPYDIPSHDSFDCCLKEELDRLVQQIRSKPALRRTPGLLADVEGNVNRIKAALDFEREGKTEQARQKILSILKDYQDDPFFISDLDKSYAFRGIAPFPDLRTKGYDYTKNLTEPLTFFRCRKGEKTRRTDMVHIPLSRRSKVSANRFSLPGIPCLYLSVTTYCCWKELRCPEQWSASAFIPNNKGKRLKILNLINDPRLIGGFDWNEASPMSKTAKSLWRMLPLTLSVSARVSTEESCGYVPEYTISNLIMRCLKDAELGGVAYLSVRCDNKLGPYPQGVNLALPVFSSSCNKNYGDVCGCFEMTDPVRFDTNSFLLIQKTDSKSYINKIYTKGVSSMVQTPYGPAKYSTTLFGQADNQLCGMKFSPFEKTS